MQRRGRDRIFEPFFTTKRMLVQGSVCGSPKRLLNVTTARLRFIQATRMAHRALRSKFPYRSLKMGRRLFRRHCAAGSKGGGAEGGKVSGKVWVELPIKPRIGRRRIKHFGTFVPLFGSPMTRVRWYGEFRLPRLQRAVLQGLALTQEAHAQ
jgi:hypothetical protein